MSDNRETDAAAKGGADLRAAGDTVRQAGQQVQQAGVEAAGHARDVAQEALSRGSALAGEARDRAASAAQSQKEGLADRLEDVAQAVHRSGEQLEGHQDWVASLVEKGADELAALANTLRQNDLRSLMSNVESLARRQPALFAGASLAAGFALARVGRVAVAGMSRADLPHTPETMPKATPGAAHERE